MIAERETNPTAVERKPHLHEFAFAAHLSSNALRNIRQICTGARALAPLRHVVDKADIAVDPVAHLPCAYALERARATPFQRQHGGTLQSTPRKADHFAILRACRIGTSGRKVEVYVLSGNKEWMCEENLRERRRLVAKEDDEGRAAFGQNRAECKINLRKAWRASLVFECMLQFNVCKTGWFGCRRWE